MVLDQATQSSAHKPTTFGQVVKNAVFNTGAWGVNVLLAIVATPLIVHKLTAEGYGIYALLSGLVGYYNLMDLGIGQGVTKYVAEYKAKGDSQGVNQCINAAMWIQVAIGLVLSIGLVAYSESILKMLHISSGYWEDARASLYITAIGFPVMMIVGALSAALMGLQRYDLTSTVGSLTNIILTLLIVFVLLLGSGLREVMYLTAASGGVLFIAYFVLLKRLVPTWQSLTFIEVRYLWKLFSFSSYVFISRVSNLFSNYIVRFVVGIFLGPAMVTYYVVPSKLVNAIGSFLSGSFAVLFPFASEVGAHSDESQIQIQRLFLDGSKLFAALSVPLFLTLAVASKPILTVWMGVEFAENGWAVLSLLAMASLCGALTTVPNLVTMGLGYSRVIGIYSLINVVLYAVCLPVFTSQWGVEGTAWAMLFVALPSILLVAYQAKTIIRLQVRYYLEHALGFHLVPLVVSVGVGLLVSSVRIPRFIAVVIPILYICGYCCLMILYGVIPLERLVGRFRGFLH